MCEFEPQTIQSLNTKQFRERERCSWRVSKRL